eukprot:Clim_evm43s88 gene=Clim_evmTU43s88
MTTPSRNVESCVLDATVETVWNVIKGCQHGWWNLVTGCELDNCAATEVGGVRKITFKDGTVQMVKVIEVSELEYYVTYEVISSEPALKVMSSVSTMRLYRVSETNQTFMEWTTNFSSDADQEVVQDNKYKKLDAFNDLRKSLTK